MHDISKVDFTNIKKKRINIRKASITTISTFIYKYFKYLFFYMIKYRKTSMTTT